MTDQAELEQDDSPEAGIEALRQQIAAAEERTRKAEEDRETERRSREGERAAREEAERRASAAAEEAQQLRRQHSDVEYDSVINAEAAAKGQLETAKTALQSAMAEGDFAKVAELSADIGDFAAQVREFETAKRAIERRRTAGADQQQQQQRQTTGDPKEDYIRQMPPKTAAWLRRHDRFFTDGNFRQMVQGAHQLAAGRGLEPESDEYFRFVEEQSGLRQDQTATAEAPASAAGQTAQRLSPPTPAAPPAGSTQGATRATATPGSVTLTPEERELCRTMEINEVAYAKQKAILAAEGNIGR